jgi:hypothetical protein
VFNIDQRNFGPMRYVGAIAGAWPRQRREMRHRTISQNRLGRPLFMRTYLSSLLLVAALAGPSAGCAARIYDEPRQDYHHWNGREERAYRVYLAERHREYREFGRLERRDQEEYWEWRHSHPDRENGRERDRDRR